MLEKTAASLEPCGLQRVLPVATNSFRSRRQLHTAFWQHGAADVELSNAWQLLMHGVLDSGIDTAATTPNLDPNPDSNSSPSTCDVRHPALRASSFLLDFLYPTGTAAFLRRFSPVFSERLDLYTPPSTFAKVSPRLYSSSAAMQDPETHDNVAVGSAAKQLEMAAEAARAIREKGLSERELADIFEVEKSDHLEKLMVLLVSDNPEDADKVWFHYTSLDGHSRQLYLGQTLVFLSKTGRVTDSWKISELFSQLDSSRWDSYSFVAGLDAEMDLQNIKRAEDIFIQGLENVNIDRRSLVDAFDIMLTAALKSPSKDQLLDIWKHYDKMVARFNFEGITSLLTRVRSVPDLPDLVIKFKPYFKQEKGSKRIDSLKKLLVRRALMVCSDNQALTLLRMTNDHLAYEEFIRSSRPESNARMLLLTKIYKIYRDLPQSCPSHPVLHIIFGAYKSMRARDIKFPGMEMLWGDWHTFHKSPTAHAFKSFMAFYATAGSKSHVYALWKDYQTRGETNIQSPETFTYLLQVHAVRGELLEARQIFDDISTKFRLVPNRYCWTILLNAHVQAGDYGGALKTFEKLCEALGDMDHVSVGTIMRMTADRGDLGLTVDIYRRARRHHVISGNIPILCCLIDAYCQNDLFGEAEALCVRAAGKGLKEPRLWNRVLNAYAHRRNLAGINGLLGRMTELDVPYNEYTYQELLTGLALCKQSQHALHLLAVAIQDGAFEVNEGHFHTIMGAFIKTGESDLVVKMHKLMQKCGFKESADSLVALVTAFSQWSRLPHKRRRGQHSQETLLGAALRRFYRVYGIRNADKRHPEKAQPSSQPVSADRLLRGDKQAFHFSRLIYIFTQMKDYVKVQELVDMYRYVAYGDTQSSEPLPIKILNSIMWADLFEKNYESLRQTWGMMFSMAQEGSLSPEWSERRPHTQKVSSRFRYILNDGLKVMQTMYLQQGDPVAMQKLFEEVRLAGFEVDSKNWNLHVQGLVQCHAYKEAFEICEKWLMPNWTGWAKARQRENMKNAVPLDLRRKGQWPRYLRPVSHTLYYLAKGYLELDKMAPWSGEAAKIMKDVQQDCPRCFRAISSMRRVGTNLEHEILGDDISKLLDAEDGDDEAALDEEEEEQAYGSDGDGAPSDIAESADEYPSLASGNEVLEDENVEVWR
ncbi:hypothetical protein BKA67DRAFT_545862 [Truncatella angustata]|uniref:Pentatricopeptide repeat-containing protein n=1 Tax=Truncatella angustata TaxID=152316 RepID=A0A9P8UWT2_9PEZI|nr:uncharacterized protein BKA67DRAFT_545862 [Truncatella angustata]KAH6659815.1 hypothetical protein BKA67DRAFT_545862 [Truncatella angustata]